jgi:peptidyl-prolyl cis-trans isomerase B (cyclophilin B)
VRRPENAPADGVYPAGTIAMARQSGNADSQGSQFFIVYEDTTLPADAAGGYTVIGRVTSGIDALRTDITDFGTADGSTDGAPVRPVSITEFGLE